MNGGFSAESSDKSLPAVTLRPVLSLNLCLRRYSKVKSRAALLIILHPELASMRFDNRSANGQSHSKPIAFCRIEWFKDFIDLGATYSDSSIANRNCQHTSAIQFSAQRDLALARRQILHSIKSIQQ